MGKRTLSSLLTAWKASKEQAKTTSEEEPEIKPKVEQVQGPDTCFVCKSRIRHKEVIYIGNNLYRHKRCFPGSSKWMKHMKNDPRVTKEIYELFEKQKEVRNGRNKDHNRPGYVAH